MFKKVVDSNVFMAEEAERTLISMSSHLSEGKMIHSLLSYSNNKNIIIRSQVCRCITVIFLKLKAAKGGKKMGNHHSNDELKIISLIGNYLSDAG